jgi:ATP-dependent helicase HrpA
VEHLTWDLQAALVDAAVAETGLPRTTAAYQKLRDHLRRTLEDSAYEALQTASDLVKQANTLEAEASKVASLAVLNSVTDLRDHVADLTGAGFLSRAGKRRWPDLKRYLKAEAYRLSKMGANRAREEQALWELGELGRAYQAARAKAGEPEPLALAEIPWMLEELRVSLFAQRLGTAYSVSPQRIRRALAAWES